MVKVLEVLTGGSVSKFNKQVGGVNMMVLYYSDNCRYCNEMKDEWLEFQEESKKKPYDITVARVNSNHLKDINADNDVLGYPSIFHLFNGKKIDEFKGERTKDGFHQFLQDISKKIESSNSRKSSILDKENEPTFLSNYESEIENNDDIILDDSIEIYNPMEESMSNTRSKTKSRTMSKRKHKSKTKTRSKPISKSKTKSRSRSKSISKSKTRSKIPKKSTRSNTKTMKSNKKRSLSKPSITSSDRYPFAKSFSLG